MRKKKIIILGAKGFHSVACHDWGENDLPNIADYDIVIVNVVSLTKNLSCLNIANLERIKSELIKLLISNGTIYAVSCPFKTEEIIIYKFDNKGNIIEEQTVRNIINNYMWSPITLNIINEKGNTIEVKDASFEDYFKNVKEWYFIIKTKEEITPENAIGDYYYEDIGPFKITESKTWMNKLATNRMREAIAAKFYYEFTILIKGSSLKDFSMKSTKKSGYFILLPLATEMNDIEAINYILEKHLGVFQKIPPPDWAKAIQVPNLNKIQSELETIESEINRLEKEKGKLMEKEKELGSFRELIYETGHPLEEIVRKVFTELGYPPKTPKFGEEYIIEFNNILGIIECKGVKKSISRRDFRQLLDYVKNYETEPDLSNLKIKGILIANAWRNLKPEQRNSRAKPIFPSGQSGVIEIAKKHHMALVNTIDLFKIFCKYKEGKIKQRKILEAIFKADGIVKFQN